MKQYNICKRIFDFFAALVASIFFLIPWLIIGIIIKIQSPGPAVYKAVRVGKDGKFFTMYKFRTMRVDSGKIHTTTLRNDPRIFPFGRFLRTSKLDETPQLINIIKGNMSVIGPRPEDKDNADRLYSGKYKEILTATPGLSSPASLYDYTFGERYESEELYEEEFLHKKLDLELYYVKNRSLLYDFNTICKTILTIVQISFGKKNFKLPRELELIDHEHQKV